MPPPSQVMEQYHAHGPWACWSTSAVSSTMPPPSQVIEQYLASRTWTTGMLVDLGGALLMIVAFANAPVSALRRGRYPRSVCLETLDQHTPTTGAIFYPTLPSHLPFSPHAPAALHPAPLLTPGQAAGQHHPQLRVLRPPPPALPEGPFGSPFT